MYGFQNDAEYIIHGIKMYKKIYQQSTETFLLDVSKLDFVFIVQRGGNNIHSVERDCREELRNDGLICVCKSDFFLPFFFKSQSTLFVFE